MRRWCETAFSFKPLKHNKTMKGLLPKQWCVACKNKDTDTPELLEWRKFGWVGNGFITNDKTWIKDNDGSYGVRTLIAYQTFLDLVYIPWKSPSDKWVIKITEENQDILIPWWKKTNPNSAFAGPIVSFALLSEHPTDNSNYWCGDVKTFLDNNSDYRIITLEEFKTITSKTTTPSMDTAKTIQISRGLLNEYYDAATTFQREFINDNFKVDGTTTVESIIELHNIACEAWKDIIKLRHPNCFPVTKSAIELAVEKAGGPNYSGCNVKIEDHYILVKLPTANKEWSLAAFEWVIKFCEENPGCYPVHRSSNNNNDYLYIQWND
jgi:hypothetical protein